VADAHPLMSTADNVREPTNRRVELHVDLHQAAPPERGPPPTC
jgi:hypothetical protein